MKDKEKQIEEMAKDLVGEDYAVVIVQARTTSLSNQTKKHLQKLIKKGWVKLPKDSVVLSKEKYELLVECSSYEGVMKALKNEYTKGSKETAEKFIKECKKYKVKKFSPICIDQRQTGVSWIEVPEWKFDEFAKQFGVEIKEN